MLSVSGYALPSSSHNGILQQIWICWQKTFDEDITIHNCCSWQALMSCSIVLCHLDFPLDLWTDSRVVSLHQSSQAGTVEGIGQRLRGCKSDDRRHRFWKVFQSQDNVPRCSKSFLFSLVSIYIIVYSPWLHRRFEAVLRQTCLHVVLNSWQVQPSQASKSGGRKPKSTSAKLLDSPELPWHLWHGIGYFATNGCLWSLLSKPHMIHMIIINQTVQTCSNSSGFACLCDNWSAKLTSQIRTLFDASSPTQRRRLDAVDHHGSWWILQDPHLVLATVEGWKLLQVPNKFNSPLARDLSQVQHDFHTNHSRYTHSVNRIKIRGLYAGLLEDFSWSLTDPEILWRNLEKDS